nr:hypothetical protein [Tanacetum cinerariifolium]
MLQSCPLLLSVYMICVQQLVHLMVTKVKRKQWLADMHQRKQRRLSMQRWLRTFRNAPDLGWCLRIPLVIEKPQLVAINNRTLSLQNATGQLGMSADQLRGRLNANGIGLWWGLCLKPTKRSYKQRLYFSEQTDGIVPNTLVIADCNFDKFAIPDHISQVNSSTRKAAPQFFKVVKTIRHPGEVKRITEFPQYQRIVATHTDSPKVLEGHTSNAEFALAIASLSPRGIFQGHTDTVEDVQFHPKRSFAVLEMTLASYCGMKEVLEGHTSNAEFALAMCLTQPYVLSGGDSTNRAVSIVKTADSASLSPSGIFQGHMDTVEDVQFHPKSTQEFCSVGDDSCLILWDERGGKVPITMVEKAHNLDVQCVDLNHLDDNYILNGYIFISSLSRLRIVKLWRIFKEEFTFNSADKSVCMFDRRKLISAGVGAGVGASVYPFMEHKALLNCVQVFNLLIASSTDISSTSEYCSMDATI